MFQDAFRGQNVAKKEHPGDVKVKLDCTLAEFYNGSIKTVNYDANEVQHDGRTTKVVHRVEKVQVNPGFNEKTKLVFKGKGHQIPGDFPSDLVIKFKQSKNKHYMRNKDDLILTMKVSLASVLKMEPVKIKTLDGRTLAQCFDEMITP